MTDFSPETLEKLAREMVRRTNDQYEGTEISPYKIHAHAKTWELERAQNAVNVETLKAFQEAARERESALQRDLALARAGR
jgi:hypothetical protein